ncbi:GDSL-type esterase/lipase family protein [Streptomyces sp. NBC_00133]|uniref:GDSL-type esterase/lipase family protein n=1 Tax=Streptomyces sp. NBC_00133 TaxID=2903624 RepID=UPI00324401FC
MNDVWRRLPAREAEAVGIKEYAQNYAEILTTLGALSRVGVVCLSETPFGPVADPAVVKVMNERLATFNEAAARAAATAGAHFVDVWTPFTVAADELASGSGETGLSLWSDGVHLSDLGDALMQQRVEAFFTASGLISAITM